MFFVDEDQAEARQRREDGEACAEHDVRLAVHCAHEAARARAVGDAGMQRDDAGVGKAADDALLELRRERDLGHQHERLGAVAQGVFDQPQIDLGFSAPVTPCNRYG